MTELEQRAHQAELTPEDFEKILYKLAGLLDICEKHFYENPESTDEQFYELFKILHEGQEEMCHSQYEKCQPEKEWSLHRRKMVKQRKKREKEKNQ